MVVVEKASHVRWARVYLPLSSGVHQIDYDDCPKLGLTVGWVVAVDLPHHRLVLLHGACWNLTRLPEIQTRH
jgi:hypothetical protein